MPIDWSHCPAVRTNPGYISGAAALLHDPRVPAETIIVNMDEGMSAEEVIETFGLETPLEDVLAVYAYAKAQRVAHPVRCERSPTACSPADTVYNANRLHSGLIYKPPNEFEAELGWINNARRDKSKTL